MSHAFDTGIAFAQRTVMERGVVTVLAPLKRSAGGYLADVIAFGGVVRSYTDEDGLQGLIKMFARTPTIGASTATREFETLGLGGKQAMSECELLLYFANQHSRDPLSGRQQQDVTSSIDDTADPGLHIMMEHALELMHGAYLTATVGTVKQLRIVREQELVTDERMTVWLQTYRVKLQSYTGGGQWRTAEQLLESIGWRTTTDVTEVELPDPAEQPTTVDVETDLTP